MALSTADMINIGLLAALSGQDVTSDINSGFDQSMQDFLEYMAKAEEELRKHEAQGRTDITGYLSEAQKYTEPYRQAGESALEAYEGTLGLGGGEAQQSALKSFQTSPGYQYALQQGMNTVNANAAAGGYGQSGAEQKALLQESQNLANQEYEKYQNRLYGLSGMGQRSAESAADRAFRTGGLLADYGQRYARDYSSMYGNIAKAMAEEDVAKTIAESRARASQASGVGGLVSDITGHLGF